MPNRLKDKVAMIVGAGSIGPGWGNGKATAVACAREGAKVAITSRREGLLQEAAREIAAAGGTAVPPALAVLLVLIVIPLYLVVWVRLILMTPAAAVEPIGPIAMIARSWRLTAGHFWKLLGFLLLIIVVGLVTLMAVGAVFGILIALIVGTPEPGNLAMFLISLVSALVQAVVSGIVTAFIARIYAQLAGAGRADVFGQPTSGS